MVESNRAVPSWSQSHSAIPEALPVASQVLREFGLRRSQDLLGLGGGDFSGQAFRARPASLRPRRVSRHDHSQSYREGKVHLRVEQALGASFRRGTVGGRFHPQADASQFAREPGDDRGVSANLEGVPSGRSAVASVASVALAWRQTSDSRHRATTSWQGPPHCSIRPSSATLAFTRATVLQLGRQPMPRPT